MNVDIGANPSAEGGDDDEGVDDQAVKVVDIVDTFRLQVSELNYSTAAFDDFITVADFWFLYSCCADLFSLIKCRNNLLLTKSNLLPS